MSAWAGGLSLFLLHGVALAPFVALIAVRVLLVALVGVPPLALTVLPLVPPGSLILLPLIPPGSLIPLSAPPLPLPLPLPALATPGPAAVLLAPVVVLVAIHELTIASQMQKCRILQRPALSCGRQQTDQMNFLHNAFPNDSANVFCSNYRAGLLVSRKILL